MPGILRTMHDDVDLSDRVERAGAHYFAIGTYSDVWMGKLTNGSGKPKEVVLKVLRGGPIGQAAFLQALRQDLLRVGAIWQGFDHPNVAGFLGLAFNVGNMPALVLRFYAAGNVMEYIRNQNISNDNKLPLVKGIACGLKYLHERTPPIIHGDIRGANVLIDEAGCPVLADYGLTFIIDTSSFTSARTVGLSRWTAPELMELPPEGQEGSPPYSTASDIFAFAMTVIEIYTEKPPFDTKKRDNGIVFVLLRGDRPDLPRYIEERPILADVVQRCWIQEPSQRLSAAEACELLDTIATDSWFRRFFDVLLGSLWP